MRHATSGLVASRATTPDPPFAQHQFGVNLLWLGLKIRTAYRPLREIMFGPCCPCEMVIQPDAYPRRSEAFRKMQRYISEDLHVSAMTVGS
jgi:hypothetical protein